MNCTNSVHWTQEVDHTIFLLAHRRGWSFEVDRTVDSTPLTRLPREEEIFLLKTPDPVVIGRKWSWGFRWRHLRIVIVHYRLNLPEYLRQFDPSGPSDEPVRPCNAQEAS